MKYLRCALALLCIPATLVFHWVAFPLSNQLPGVSFSIAGYVRGHTPPTLASYGVLAAVILMIAALMLLITDEAIHRQRWTFIYVAGAALLTLGVSAPIQVALGNPALLKDLAEEANWLKAADNFAQTYLPLNLGNEATNWPFLSFDTLAGRLLSGWYFMGLGWYVTLIAAAVLMTAGARNMKRTARRRAAGATAAAVSLVAAAFLLSPLAGQRTLLAAIRAESRGDIAAASRLYRAAFRLDGWNALKIELHARAGAIDAALGRTASSDYDVYRAESLLSRNLIPSAIAQYDSLAAANGPLRGIARTRAVWLRTVYGLQLYQTGAFGAAAQTWEGALQREPSMWLAAFYLSRGYFAVGRYREAAQVAQRCITQVGDPEFIANLYSDMGDAHTRDARLQSGHLAYFHSYRLDYADNRRGLTGPTGP